MMMNDDDHEPRLREHRVEGVVREQEAQSCSGTICGQTLLADPPQSVEGTAEADLLPVDVVGHALCVLLDLTAQDYDLGRPLFHLSELEHALAKAISQDELAVAIPRPSDALACPNSAKSSRAPPFAKHIDAILCSIQGTGTRNVGTAKHKRHETEFLIFSQCCLNVAQLLRG